LWQPLHIKKEINQKLEIDVRTYFTDSAAHTVAGLAEKANWT
jgi:hypothetical protein